MPRHKPLDDDLKPTAGFEGIINTKRVKDFGYRALTIARNVEMTDTKRITRRNGYVLRTAGNYTALYGTDNEAKKYAVKNGNLYDIDIAGVETLLASGLLGTQFSWDEDPANNIYFCSELGSSGIITNAGVFLPLALPVPVIVSAGVVDPGSWEYRPFQLGKGYSDSPNVRMQLLATYVMADGRESAPSDIATIAVAPEIRMVRVIVPPAGVATRIYATAPGGSTYYLVGTTTQGVTTLLVQNMNWRSTGVKYPFTVDLASFPDDARILAQTKHGKLMAGCYDPGVDLGTIYLSKPMQYHLFPMGSDFVSVSGCPLLLLPHKAGIIIGTSSSVYNYDPDASINGTKTLTEIANYGVVAGACGDVDKDGTPYFWTVRGIAKAMPFELVTQENFYGDPGVFNATKIIYDRGYAKLVASTISGAPTFNKWTER